MEIISFLNSIITKNITSLEELYLIILNESIKLTESRFGFIFAFHESPEKGKLFAIEGEVPDELKWLIADNKEGIGFAGLWCSAFDNGRVMLHNTASDIKLFREEEIINIEVERFCSVPIKLVDGFSFCIVIAGKVSDYIFPEDQIISLTDLIKGIIVNKLTVMKLRKELDQFKVSENRRRSFVSNITHEIKTPLNALSGFSRLLMEPDLKEENRQKFLDIILESSGSLITTINNFSEVWEVETGRINISVNAINLSVLINFISDNFRSEALKKNLGFEIILPNIKKETNILSDEGKLISIIESLISNSLKYTYSGKITLGYKVRNEEIEFSVTDTGIGIPEEEKQKVFDISTAGSSLIKTSKGSGLGLFISKAYVEKLGGRMWFESTEGKGSIFYFTVPNKPVSEEILNAKEKLQSKSNIENAKKTVLVAEDDKMNFFLIKNYLSKMNINLIWAENGQQAIDLYLKNKVDLVLMDIRMPVMDGYTASKKIKETNPSQIIIAQTAFSTDRSVALANGCDDFIAKPFEKHQLIALVEGYLSNINK